MFFNLFGQKHTCKRGFDGLKKGDKFHFIAMGGVGQSALAKILLKLGYEVSGSDINDSKYLKELKSLVPRFLLVIMQIMCRLIASLFYLLQLRKIILN